MPITHPSEASPDTTIREINAALDSAKLAFAGITGETLYLKRLKGFDPYLDQAQLTSILQKALVGPNIERALADICSVSFD